MSTERRIRRGRRPEPERYELDRFEVCEVRAAGGRVSVRRVHATADTLAGARLALRTIAEESDLEPRRLRIRDGRRGRWLEP